MRRAGPFYPGLVALWSLSSVPWPGGVEVRDDDLVRSAPWFPLIGGLVGAVLALLAKVFLGLGWAPVIAAVLLTLTVIGLTGAVPELGLVRAVESTGSAQGLLRMDGMSARGVMALIGFLALRTAGLMGTSTAVWIGALVTAHMIARWAVLFLLTLGDRLDERSAGERRTLPLGKISWPAFGVSTALTAVIAALIAGTVGLVALLCIAALAFASGLYLQHRSGGMTERALAAIACTCEVAVLLAFAAAYPA